MCCNLIWVSWNKMCNHKKGSNKRFLNTWCPKINSQSNISWIWSVSGRAGPCCISWLHSSLESEHTCVLYTRHALMPSNTNEDFLECLCSAWVYCKLWIVAFLLCKTFLLLEKHNGLITENKMFNTLIPIPSLENIALVFPLQWKKREVKMDERSRK